MSVEFLIYAFQRWWLRAALVSLLLAGLGGLCVWYLLPPTFRADAWLRIEDRKPMLVFSDTGDSKLFVKTHVEMIRSPIVLQNVLEQPGVSQLPDFYNLESPRELLTKKLLVKSVGSSELFQISFDGSSPEAAAAVVNAVTTSFLKMQEEMADDKTTATIALLEKEKADRTKDLARMQENLRKLAKQQAATGQFVRSGSMVLSMQSPLGQLQERLTAIEVDWAIQEAQLNAYKDAWNKQDLQVPQDILNAAVESHGSVQEKLATVELLEKKIEDVRLVAARGDRDPTIIRLQKDLKDTNDALTKTRQTLAENLAVHMQGTVKSEHEAKIAELQSKQDSQLRLKDVLLDRLATEREKLEKQGDGSLELEFAREEFARAEQVFERIADRTLALKTEMRAPARITLFKTATAADAIQMRSRNKQLVMVLGIALCLPLALAVAWERQQRRVAGSQQFSSDARLPLLAEIAAMPSRTGMLSGARQERLMQTYEESIDLLRASLTLPDNLQNVGVFAVASAVSGEGKTSLASQLATSLAKTSRKPVLLIDGDLRVPDLHDLFNVPLEPGLSKVLDGSHEARDCIVKTSHDNLDVIPAGRLHQNPHCLMTADALQNLIAELRPLYRYIVIDAPPVLSAGEALVIAKIADATLLCAMRDVSRAPQVRLAYDRLTAAGARPLGTVLSGVPSRSFEYRYGSSYYAAASHA